MAVVNFRIGEGSRTTTRTVQAVLASGFVRVNTALVTASPGDTVEIFTGGLSGNIGFYTIYGLSGTLGYYLRPFPNLQAGAGGSIARLNRTGTIATAATAISGIIVLSGTGSLAAVWVPGANFRSAGVQRNDRAVISGSSISGNWGAWFVQAVPADDMVILRPPDRGAGLAAESPGTGTVVFRHGVHVAKIVPVSGEAIGWSTLAASGILPVSGASLYQGSGELRDYVQKRTINATGFYRDVFLIEGLGIVGIAASGLSDVTWTSRDEIVLGMRPELTSGGGSNTGDNVAMALAAISGSPAEPIDLQLGANPFGDRYSVISGSVWVGFGFGTPGAQAALVKTSLWGSYFDAPAAVQIAVSTGASGVASIYRPGLSLISGALLESVIGYGSIGLNPTGAADSENFLLGSNITAQNISNAGAVLGGLILAGAVTQPLAATFFSSGAPAVILDPRVDFNIFDYFYIFTAGGSIEKRFTLNPRFVSLDAPAADPAAIDDLTVEIYEVDEATGNETLYFTGTTDSDGYLAAGDGVQLRRQTITGGTGYQLGTLTEYAHRMTVQGGGFRLENRLFALTARNDADLTVQRIAPDYESEFDE